MKRNLIKLIAVTCMVVVSTSALTACKKEKTEETNTQNTAAKAGEIKMFIRATNDTAKNYQPVFDEFEKRTKDTLNTKVNITVIPAADYKQTMQLKVAAQEDMDLVFDAPFLNLTTFANQGVYQDLGKYFNNDAYPGLKKAFSKDFLNNNKFYDKNYAVPLTNTFTDLNVFYYREDLRKKYGVKEFNSYDDVEAYWKAIQANEPAMTPLGSKGGTGRLFQDTSRKRDGNIYSIDGIPGGIEAGISKDGKTVLAVTSQSEPASAFSSYPAPWNKADTSNYDAVKKYVNYINKDSLVAKEIEPLFKAGKVASVEGTISNFVNYQAELKKAVPTAELGFWLANADERAMKKGAIVTDWKAWNFLTIPTSSKNADRSMKFLNWVFESQDNNDLLQYGIQGKNWEKVGANKWKLPAGLDSANNFSFPGYELTWNPNYIKLPDGISETVEKAFNYQYSTDTFVTSKIAGFTFDQTNVKSEIAKLSAIDSEFNLPLAVGQVESVSGTLAKKLEKQKAAGLDTLKAEVKKQLQAYLDSKK
jgi:putative aldouronate transport system substrate-binding protein